MKTKLIQLLLQLSICVFVASCTSSVPTLETDNRDSTKPKTPTLTLSSTIQPTSTHSPSPTQDIYLLEVISDNVYIRTCPLPSCETIYQLEKGYQIRAIGRNDNAAFAWYQVEDQSGITGWVMDNDRQVHIPNELWNNLTEIVWNTPTPLPTPTINPEYTLIRLCKSNIYDRWNPLQGRAARYETPIDINTKGRPEVIEAIENIEVATGGLVTFNIVDSDPDVGISVVIGKSTTSNGHPNCGTVTNFADLSGDPSNPEYYLDMRVSNDGLINSVRYVHLGSSQCDHTSIVPTVRGFTSITEHELAHALGLGEHFDDFNGNEGFSGSVIAVIKMLYSIQPGTNMASECSGK